MKAPRLKPLLRGCLECAGWLLAVGFLVYAAICLLAAVQQRKLIYHPTVFTARQVDQMAESARLERWTNSAGQFIGLKRLSPKQPAGGTVLILYGNGNAATSCDHYANDIQSVAAFDVFILEYPGYEDRPGSPSQDSLFRAAAEGFKNLPAGKPVYLLGESLGTGVASYLAGSCSNKIAGVLLLSPFNSLTDVAQEHFPLLPVRWLLVDRFPSEKYLSRYHGQVGIAVDGRDDIVPEKFGRRLYHGYAGPKRLWEFPGGGHCQVVGQPADFWREVIAFWQANPAVEK